MPENVKESVRKLLRDVPDKSYIANITDESIDYDYAIIEDIYVSTGYKISSESEIETGKVAVRLGFKDRSKKIVTYPEYQEMTGDHYLCPNCGSNRVRSDDVLSGRIHCQVCEFDNYD